MTRLSGLRVHEADAADSFLGYTNSSRAYIIISQKVNPYTELQSQSILSHLIGFHGLKAILILHKD